MSYKIEIDKERTIIKKYSYNSFKGIGVCTTPTIAYRILLNYYKEYGDLTYTDYLVTDTSLDFIEIFKQSYNEDNNEFTYFSSQIIKKGDPVVFKNYRNPEYGLLQDFNNNTVWIKDSNTIIDISLYAFAVLNYNHNKAEILNEMISTL